MTTRYLNASKTTRRSPNYESGRTGSNITGITIHWWDDPANAPSFNGVVSWLCNPTAQVSAHFVVEDSRVACLVHPRNKAWHARSGNTGTIGIECNPRASQADRDTLVGLIVALWLNYGKVPLYKHNHWVQTDCPGVYGTTYWQQILNDANRLMLAVTHDSGRRALYRKAWWDTVDTGSGTSFIPGNNITHQTVDIDGYWGSSTTRALQRIMGTPQDGVISNQDVYWKAKNPGLTTGWEWVNNATGSQLIVKLQKLWGVTPADGIVGSGTIRAMQKYYGTIQDGTLDEGSSAIMAMQRWINDKLAPTPAPTPPNTGGTTPSPSITVDGYWGADTTRALQKKYGTPQDGVISSQDVYWKSKNPGLTGGWEWVTNASGSQLIARLQKEWGIPNGDGIIGPNTIKAMQRHYKVAVTGTLTENAPAIRKMQEQLRQGTKPNNGNSGGEHPPAPNKPNNGTTSAGGYKKLIQWISEVEEEFLRRHTSIRSQKAPVEHAGVHILEWMRKPDYWNSSVFSGLLWQIYTPETHEATNIMGDSERTSNRNLIHKICASKTDIRNEYPQDDLKHFAATFLGYYHWGVLRNNALAGPGDLGGWALDLVQIWGSYAASGSTDSLQNWIGRHLNIQGDTRGFGRADLVADVDAYLLAAKYYDPHKKRLSQALQDLYSKAEDQRVREFYELRFGSSVEKVQWAFWFVVATGYSTEFPFIGGPIHWAGSTSTLPNKEQSDLLGSLLAEHLKRGTVANG